MTSIGHSVGKLRIDMLHPLDEMFSKNRHVCSRIAETTVTSFPQMQGGKVPDSVCDCINIKKLRC